MINLTITTEQAKELEQFLQKHIDNLYNFDDEQDDIFTYGLYDGCDTCNTREYLMAIFDYFRTASILDLEID
jgi:hypothetical protein